MVAVYGGGPNVVANGFGLFVLLLFGIIFSSSWNSLCRVYCTEIFPTSIRATGGAIGTFRSFVIQVNLAHASHTALANVGRYAFQPALSEGSLTLRRRYYSFFIVMNVLTPVLVFCFVPETFGRTLDEVNEVFGDIFVNVRMADEIDPEKLNVGEVSRSKAERAFTKRPVRCRRPDTVCVTSAPLKAPSKPSPTVNDTPGLRVCGDFVIRP